MSSQPAPSATTSLLGKQELLQWACQHSAVPQCTRYDDLKDGFVFLCLAEKLWPAFIDGGVVRNQRRGHRTTRVNWELLRSVMANVGLPIHLCDPKGVAAGHQRPCYNLLVLFYFLSKLATTSEFSVDFAHPIDEVLAEFLQSTQSIQCLAKGQHAVPERGYPAGAGRVGGGSSPTAGGDSGSRSVSPAHPAPSPNRRGPPTATPRPHHAGSNTTTPRGRGGGTPLVETTTYENELSFLSSAAGGGGNATPTAAAAPRAATSTSGYHREQQQQQQQNARKAKELLEQELTHVKVMSKHMLEQQRMLVEAEMARTTSQFQSHLATTRMELEFDATQTILAVKTAYDRTLEDIALERSAARSSDGGSGGSAEQEVVSLRQANAVLLGKLQAMDEAVERSSRQAAQWKEALEQTRGQQDRVLAALQASALRNAQLLSSSAMFDERSPLVMELNDRLTAAEKAPVVGFLRQCQLEAKEYKLQAERLEAEKQAWIASSTRGGGATLGHDPGPWTPEISGAATANAAPSDPTARLQVQRLSKVNALLHEQLGLLRRSGGGGGSGEDMAKVLQAPDTRAEVLTSGGGSGGGTVSIPSTWIGGAASVDVVAASALERLKSMLAVQQQPGGGMGGGPPSRSPPPPAADADAILSVFWSVTAAAQVMQLRLRNCGATVRELSSALAGCQRQLIVERHRHSKELREQTDALREELRQNHASARRAASDTELDMKLIRDELAVARRDVPQSFSRFQAMTAEIIAECEHLMTGPLERSKALARQNHQLRSRDQQWQQAVELLAAASNKPPAERFTAEQQAQRILEQLRATLPAVGGGSGHDNVSGTATGGGREDSDAIHNALRRVEDNLTHAMRTAMGQLQQSQVLSDELRRVAQELADAKAEVELRRAVEEAAQRECQLLRRAASDTNEAVAGLRASEEALQAALGATHREEQKNIEETLQYLATAAAAGGGGGGRPGGSGLPHLTAVSPLPSGTTATNTLQYTSATKHQQQPPPPTQQSQQQRGGYGGSGNGDDVINTVREWVTSATTFQSAVARQQQGSDAAGGGAAGGQVGAQAGDSNSSANAGVGVATSSAAPATTGQKSHQHVLHQQWGGSTQEPSEAGSSQPPLSQRTASVLTPEELERRKEEILLKYGVKGTSSNNR